MPFSKVVRPASGGPRWILSGVRVLAHRSLPWVAGAGKTSSELRDSLTTSLKEYVTNPVVTVMVQEAASAQIHVIGEVEHPGTQVMQGPRTILQALAEAGGLGEFADRNGVHVLRNTATGLQNIPFNYKEALKGRVEPLYLQPGDTVVVP